MGEINSGDLFEDGVAVDLHGTLLAVTSFFLFCVVVRAQHIVCGGVLQTVNNKLSHTVSSDKLSR